MKKDTIRKIFATIIYIILIVFIIIETIALIQNSNNSSEATVGVFGIKAFSIISGSMEPTIQINDIIFVKKVAENELKQNDIISFTIDGETITHRIVGIRKSEDGKFYYKTKGDANNTEDIEEITYSSIEGKYIGKIPKLGKIIENLQNRFVLISIIIIFIMFYIVNQNSNEKRRKRKEIRLEYERKNEEK